MTRRTVCRLAAALLAVLAISGCGLKGPLFLPEKSERVIIRGPGGEPVTGTPAPAAGSTSPAATPAAPAAATGAAPATGPATGSQEAAPPRDERPPPPPLPGGGPGS